MNSFLYEHQLFFAYVSWFILSIGLLQNFIYAFQLPAAWLELRRRSQADDTESSWQILLSDVALPISIIVPAFNEEAGIVGTVQSLLSLKYPDFEVIVVNDGSTDKTLATLIDTFSLKPVFRAHELLVPHAPLRGIYGSPLYPRLIVLDKENGKAKANACNAGINIARNSLFCVVDADSLLESDALLRSIRPFMEDPDMVAVGGTIRILNGCTVESGRVTEVRLPDTFLPLVQTLEYFRAFLMSRMAWSRWGMISIISGAYSIFKRNAAIAVGGFSLDTVAEDYDLIVKMHRHMRGKNLPYSMRFVPEPVCWTEAPETLQTLGNQRKRWQRGAIEVFFKHRDMLLNARYGKVGFISFPHNFLIDVLSPMAEVMGYILIPFLWAAGLLNYNFVLAWISLFFLFGVFVSIASLTLEEMELKRVPLARDLLLLGSVSVIENFGYRQLNNIWRLIGSWQYFRKNKEWGVMARKGFPGKMKDRS